MGRTDQFACGVNVDVCSDSSDASNKHLLQIQLFKKLLPQLFCYFTCINSSCAGGKKCPQIRDGYRLGW